MNYIVLDLETQHLSWEVGGWANIPALRVAVACTFDEMHGYRTWWEVQAPDLIATLKAFPLLVGFNVKSFDYQVLSAYGDVRGLELKTFDIHDEIWEQVHQRVGLNTLAVLNLGEAKMHESGTHAVRLWRTGALEELERYCMLDVELTKRLYDAWELGLLWITGERFVEWPGPGLAALEDEEDEEE